MGPPQLKPGKRQPLQIPTTPQQNTGSYKSSQNPVIHHQKSNTNPKTLKTKPTPKKHHISSSKPSQSCQNTSKTSEVPDFCATSPGSMGPAGLRPRCVLNLRALQGRSSDGAADGAATAESYADLVRKMRAEVPGGLAFGVCLRVSTRCLNVF